MIATEGRKSNIESTMTAETDTASRYLLTGDTGEAAAPKTEPPQVLITPAIVCQMRERKRQIQALQQWDQARQEVSR
jgi:hypothetical protein